MWISASCDSKCDEIYQPAIEFIAFVYDLIVDICHDDKVYKFETLKEFVSNSYSNAMIFTNYWNVMCYISVKILLTCTFDSL